MSGLYWKADSSNGGSRLVELRERELAASVGTSGKKITNVLNLVQDVFASSGRVSPTSIAKEERRSHSAMHDAPLPCQPAPPRLLRSMLP